MASLGNRGRLVVPGDRDVDERFEDALLRGEQPVDGCLRDLGRVADRLDGRGAIPAFEEQAAGRVEHRATRQPCARLRCSCPVVSHCSRAELLASLAGGAPHVELDRVPDESLERLLIQLRVLEDVDRSSRPRIEARVEELEVRLDGDRRR